MRADEFSRRILRETTLSVADLIQPLFIIDRDNDSEKIPSMPGVERLGIAPLIKTCAQCYELGIPAVALFPSAQKKSADAQEAWNPDGLVQRAVAAIKTEVPQLGVITDIALDPYTENGQDGLCDAGGYVENDRTVAALVQQALSHAEAGADIVAPSDMMDGRVRAIRDALEDAGKTNTRILAYSAKYASSLYAPFRDAVAAAAAIKSANKFTYQMDPCNADEALRETAMDIHEGADMVMIKPALPNLDIVHRIKKTYRMPTLAYQVSGEYAMLKAAADNGWLNERDAVMEIMQCIKRAGCDGVLSYYAQEVAGWLNENRSEKSCID